MARLWTREGVLIVTPEAETHQHKIAKRAIRALKEDRKGASSSLLYRERGWFLIVYAV